MSIGKTRMNSLMRAVGSMLSPVGVGVVVVTLALIIVTIITKRDAPLEMVGVILVIFRAQRPTFMMRQKQIGVTDKITLIGCVIILNELFEALIALFERGSVVQFAIRAVVFFTVAYSIVMIRQNGLLASCSSLQRGITNANIPQ